MRRQAIPTAPEFRRGVQTCRKGRPSFDEWVRPQKVDPKGAEVVIRGDRDACADNGEGRRAERGGDSAFAGSYGGVPEVQRRAGQGGRGARGRPPLPELAEQARSVRRQEAHRYRWAVCGDQGARGRVLAMAGALDRRGPRMAQAGTL